MKYISLILILTSLLLSNNPIHSVMDNRIKGQSYSGNQTDYVASKDGLGIIPLQHHSGTSDINNELKVQKILNKVKKTTNDISILSNIKASISNGLVGTITDQENLIKFESDGTSSNIYIKKLILKNFVEPKSYKYLHFAFVGDTGRIGTIESIDGAYSNTWENTGDYVYFNSHGGLNKYKSIVTVNFADGLKASDVKSYFVHSSPWSPNNGTESFTIEVYDQENNLLETKNFTNLFTGTQTGGSGYEIIYAEKGKNLYGTVESHEWGYNSPFIPNFK